MKAGTRRRNAALFLIHLSAQALFLYMFFSAGRIEKLAEDEAISPVPGIDVRAEAMRYAAEWRHGMTVGWWLYMPGFFATGVSAWFWSQSRSAVQLGSEGVVAMAGGTILALVASESGGAEAVSDFVRDTGFRVSSSSVGLTGTTIAQGVYTLLAWTAFSICGRNCIERRSFKPLLWPAVLGCVLIAVRPFTLDDAGSIWAGRALAGDPVAVVSAILAPLTAWALVRSEFARLGRRRSDDAGSTDGYHRP
jgi:hypothetical protein